MGITKNCHTCKHEHNSSSSDPCSTCDASYKWNLDDATYNNWEPAEEEKLCRTCGVKSIVDQMLVCTHCYDHNKWRPKEEKKMDNRKTKAQLMEELEQRNAEIAELKKELERSANYEQYLDAAKEMRSMVEAFVESGFTEDQAIAIVTGVIGQATRQRVIR